MRISVMALAGIFIATAVAAEEPDVEARLEEAAGAGAVLERVLDQQQTAGQPGCQGGGCRAGSNKSRGMMKQPDASGEQTAADGVAADAKPSTSDMGGMGGMGGMQRGGMGKVGGMNASSSAALAEPDASIPSEDSVVDTVETIENESSGGMGGMGKMKRGGMGKMKMGKMGKMGGMHGGKSAMGEAPTQDEAPAPDEDPSAP